MQENDTLANGLIVTIYLEVGTFPFYYIVDHACQVTSFYYYISHAGEAFKTYDV